MKGNIPGNDIARDTFPKYDIEGDEQGQLIYTAVSMILFQSILYLSFFVFA